jgi:2-phosphosulfolactate phosphatase
MTPSLEVVIDFLPDSAARYRGTHAIVAIDVFRATTTLTTALAAGQPCYVQPSVDAAVARAATLANPLLVGEVGGNMPYGFHLTNSPAAVAALPERTRPIVLVSSSGTQLIHNARGCEALYLACLRNAAAVAAHAARRHRRIAVLGAGTRGEFREEDQLCCAWIAARLLDEGHSPASVLTREVVARWKDAPARACLVSKSTEYLARTGQQQDVEFVLSHVNDLELVPLCQGDEVLALAELDELQQP